MQSPDSCFNIGGNRLRLLIAALFVVAAMGCLFNPVAAETFPTETTRINEVHLNDENADIIAKFTSNLETLTVDVGTPLAHATVRVRISKENAATVDEAKNNTRAYLSIVGPDNILDNALGTPTYVTTMATYYLVPYQHDITPHTLQKGTYTITVVYEVLIDGVWTHADAGTYFLRVTYPFTEGAWLPLMLSFAVIAGMAFIGLNIAKPRDPVPMLFMMFAGVMLVWSAGWLQTWIFVTAIALISISSAALWGKLFRGR